MKLIDRASLLLIRAYQIFISPILFKLGVRCRFHPTCSQYAVLAIKKNGFPKGYVQIFNRLRRCNKYNLDSCLDYPD